MCGIAAAYQLSSREISPKATALVNSLLLRLQNRGDLSTGIARYNPEGFNMLDCQKGRGTAKTFFGEIGSYKHRKFLEEFSGLASIGHNRYATSGSSDDDAVVYALAHPYLRAHNRRWKEFAFAFNGNITNVDELRSSLLNDGHDYYLKTEGDTELMRVYFSRELGYLDRKPSIKDWVNIFYDFSQKFDGAYNIVFLNSQGELLLVRDPIGNHPFFYGFGDNVLVAASEDSAIRALGIDDIREVEPGTFVHCDGVHVKVSRYVPKCQPKHCIFEYIYFMNAASTFAGRSVQRARVSLGRKLAQREQLEFNENMVCGPVPGTAIGMADGYQHGAYKDRGGVFLPRFDALVKVNESRSFLADYSYISRAQIIRNKFDLTPDYLDGKEWIMLDDSIVRGNTSLQLMNYVREVCKAEKLHMRVAAAPIKFPCFYGINMPTLDELIAADDKPVEKIRKAIAADTLQYNTVEDMVDAVIGSSNLKREDFCLGCFTGEYPTEGGRKCLKKLLAQKK
ncbi:MAG TPA: hypothetical protein PKL83_04380 [bacterium]|nr:hypothetical protein [bacterium]